ncbi:MAG: PAS domain S-box protein [Promethearchaeota archaeon]
MEILNKIIITANKANNLNLLLKNILELVLKLFDYDGGSIYLINKETQVATITSHKNLRRDYVKKFNELKIENSPYRDIFIEGHPLYQENYQKVNPSWVDKWNILSLAFIPICFRGQVIGALNVISKKQHAFTDDEKSILEAIGREIGTSINGIIVENELQGIKENLQSFFDSFLDMIFILDLQGKILNANPMVLKRLKFSEKELQNKNLYDLHPLERREELKRFLKNVLEKKKDVCTIPLITKHGDLIPVETKAVRGTWNNHVRIICISRDITQYQQVELELIESERKCKTRLNNIFDIIVEINSAMRISYISPQVKEVLGYLPNQVIGMKISQLIHREDLPGILMGMKEAIKSKKVMSAECKIKNEKGYYVSIHARGSIMTHNGSYKFIGAIRDIANQKNAEQKLVESEKKYREAYEQAKFYKDILAHDMLNILQNIKSSHELLSLFYNFSGNQEQRIEFLDIIEEQVNRGKELINNIMKLSEIDGSEVFLKIFDAIKILEASIEFIKKSFSRKKISIVISTPYENVRVHANDFLSDVFENIMLNAIIYNNNPIPEIHISISQVKKKNKPYFKFEFKDNARGISDHVKELIFKQGHGKKKRSKGMGLGLFLVKKIIESYGGSLWVEDRVAGEHEKGSNFILLIPKAKRE